MITLMFLLLLKHFIVDFPLQGPYQYKNKGKLGHPGGVLHAANHAIGTLLVLLLYGGGHLWLAMVDGISHYFIDYGKVHINRAMDWTPTNSEQFWWLVGLDQWLHQMVYLIIVYVVWSA